MAYSVDGAILADGEMRSPPADFWPDSMMVVAKHRGEEFAFMVFHRDGQVCEQTLIDMVKVVRAAMWNHSETA